MAAAGHAGAMLELGKAYAEGAGLRRNPALARKWLGEARRPATRRQKRSCRPDRVDPTRPSGWRSRAMRHSGVRDEAADAAARPPHAQPGRARWGHCNP